jgi:hypothetical protein
MKRDLPTFVMTCFAALIIGLAVTYLIPPGQAQPTVSLPTATNTSVTSSPAVQIIPYNPGRRSITICNQAGTSTLTVVPVNVTSAVVTPTASIGVPIAVGTCFSPPQVLTNSGTSGGVTAAWTGIAASTTTNALVLEW